MSKLKLLKSKKGIDSQKKNADLIASSRKPPPLPKSQRSDAFLQVIVPLANCKQKDERRVERADSDLNSRSENMNFSPSINSGKAEIKLV